jgi:hypothetical protein
MEEREGGRRKAWVVHRMLLLLSSSPVAWRLLRGRKEGAKGDNIATREWGSERSR